MSGKKYEVTANMPAGSTRTQAPAMLRALLEERFHLRVHREMKRTSVFALVPGKNGVKLVPATAPKRGTGNTWIEAGVGHLRARNYTMSALADLLCKLMDRPVVDATALTALYDVDFTYANSESPPDSAPSLTAALLQLGLRLQKRDMPMEYLVVDRADKTPVEN